MNTPTSTTNIASGFPLIRQVGLSGVLVSFSDVLSDAANLAALAYRAAIDAKKLPGIVETSTSLASTFISYDPLQLPLDTLREYLLDMLNTRDWGEAELPAQRKLWRIPAVFGGASGPQLEEAAELARVSPEQAIYEISKQRVRVMTIGFAPGQPYLGALPEHWDIPRQTTLTSQVPAGSLVVAIRQLVLFTHASPTGWRLIGQTGFRNFRPADAQPFALQSGDEVQFDPVTEQELQRLSADDTSGCGGAQWEVIQ